MMPHAGPLTLQVIQSRLIIETGQLLGTIVHNVHKIDHTS